VYKYIQKGGGGGGNSADSIIIIIIMTILSSLLLIVTLVFVLVVVTDGTRPGVVASAFLSPRLAVARHLPIELVLVPFASKDGTSNRHYQKGIWALTPPVDHRCIVSPDEQARGGGGHLIVSSFSSSPPPRSKRNITTNYDAFLKRNVVVPHDSNILSNAPLLLSLLFLVFWSFPLSPAMALEQRNELLCGTGFFTNIAQYKCTDIGDISNDGKATELTAQEQSSMTSLLDKLGVVVTNNNDDDGDNNKNNNNVEKKISRNSRGGGGGVWTKATQERSPSFFF
jgi:hypothetical protein